MKKHKILIVIIAVSLILNLILVSLIAYNKNQTTELRKVWNLATNNAVFLYGQYNETDLPEAYDYAFGEVGTMFNSISYIDYGGKDRLSVSQKEEFSRFFQMLIKEDQYMKNHLTEVTEIVGLLQAEETEAFVKMKELCDGNPE